MMTFPTLMENKIHVPNNEAMPWHHIQIIWFTGWIHQDKTSFRWSEVSQQEAVGVIANHLGAAARQRQKSRMGQSLQSMD
jgi:hypothetical protein